MNQHVQARGNYYFTQAHTSIFGVKAKTGSEIERERERERERDRQTEDLPPKVWLVNLVNFFVELHQIKIALPQTFL